MSTIDPIIYQTKINDEQEIVITPLENQEKVNMGIVESNGTATVLILTSEQAGELGTNLLNAIEDIKKNKTGGM